MKQIEININEYESFSISSCITYDNTLYNKLHDNRIQIGDNLHLVVEDDNLWCDLLVEDIEYGDGTIWVKYLGDNEECLI
jgi:hypothetical protein